MIKAELEHDGSPTITLPKWAWGFVTLITVGAVATIGTFVGAKIQAGDAADRNHEKRLTVIESTRFTAEHAAKFEAKIDSLSLEVRRLREAMIRSGVETEK